MSSEENTLTCLQIQLDALWPQLIRGRAFGFLCETSAITKPPVHALAQRLAGLLSCIFII